MTNKGATVKLTEKQRETLDRLAHDLGYGYVGLSFVRPNTWRSLVAAGLVQESSTERGMFKLTEQGCAAAGVKATYVSNVRTAEAFAVIEHLRRGNDSAMRTAEAEQLRDSQVLLDPYGKRIAAVGTELVNGRTRLWTVDLDEPDQSPKWVDATPEMMNVVFARADGWARPLHMRLANTAEVFRVLGSEGCLNFGGIYLISAGGEYDIFRYRHELDREGWIACEHDGTPAARAQLREWATGSSSDPMASSYWVVPSTGERLTDRHDVLGPYATLDLAQHKRQEYVAAGHPCRVISSVTRPSLIAAPAQPVPSFAVGDQVRQLDGETAEVFEVVGETTVAVRTADGQEFEHDVEELERADAVPPMTLAQYTAHVAASTTPAHRVALGAGA